MRFILCFILSFCCCLFSARAQTSNHYGSLLQIRSADSLLTIPENGIKAAGLIFSTNMAIWAYDNFVTQAQYARINFGTIKNNFKTGFVWDNDIFICNLLSHPYNGALYHNAARSNGMSFWKSVPFNAAGSLMWEFGLENEPASINDFATTTVGGMSLGEMSFRISDLIIDERSVGFERLKREALLTIISPIRGLNRLLNGDWWKKRKIRGNTMPLPSINFSAMIGYRIITDQLKNRQGKGNTPYLNLSLYYNDLFDFENEKPFDSFRLNLGINLFSSQPIISSVNVIGTIYSKDMALRKTNRQLILGVFQHFNYYELGANNNNSSINPYKLGEAASIGPGLLYKTKLTKNINLSTSAHLSAIIMGGFQTDHYKYGARDYNLGSGFSTKLSSELELADKIKVFLRGEDYQLYSWIGYNSNETGSISTNVQGDIGKGKLDIVKLGVNYLYRKHFLIAVEGNYYYRKSTYKYYPKTEHSIDDIKLSIGYRF